MLTSEVKVLRTGPGTTVEKATLSQLRALCTTAYERLPWWERGIAPPLLQQIERNALGGIAYIDQGDGIVAAHGFLDMEDKIRLTSWGPAIRPGHADSGRVLTQAILDLGRELGKERAVMVLIGEVDGQDASEYVNHHQDCGMKTIMTRLDMRVPIQSVRLRSILEPADISWDSVSGANLDDFLSLYGEVFATSESPLAKSWSQNIGSRRWWFEQLMSGEEEEVIPGGWLMLLLEGKPQGILIMTKESDSVAQINDLGLVKQARGKGIGWLLLSKALDLAHKVEAKTLSLGVEVENRIAISLYEAAGFRMSSRKTVLLKYFTDSGQTSL